MKLRIATRQHRRIGPHQPDRHMQIGLAPASHRGIGNKELFCRHLIQSQNHYLLEDVDQ